MAHAKASIWRKTTPALGVVVLVLLTAGFVVHAASLGLSGIMRDLTGESRFYDAAGWLSTPALFLHMATGAAVMVLAPFQILGAVRRRWPIVHRTLGRVVLALAGVTSLGGLVFIGSRGTIGGPVMDIAFGLYGLALGFAVMRTVQNARRARWQHHRDWAQRLLVLALGSWLYRVHYAAWHVLTGGAASNDAFTGIFDVVTMFAFWMPYLVVLELWFIWRGPRMVSR